MPRRGDAGDQESIPRLLPIAFDKAKEGDNEKALSFWNSAVKRGCQVQEKTLRQLRNEIENGARRKASHH